MKDHELRQRFMLLRAQGASYATLTRELGVSKQTLLKWGSAHKEEIENLRAIEFETLKEQYRLTKQAQLAVYGAERLRVLEELQKRDLSAVPTPRLYDLWAKLDAQIKASCPEPVINDEDTVAAQKALRLLVSPSGNGNGTSATSAVTRSGMGGLRTEDLIDFLRDTLRRFQAREITARDARTILAVIKTLFKGVEFAELEQRLEHIEELVRCTGEA